MTEIPADEVEAHQRVQQAHANRLDGEPARLLAPTPDEYARQKLAAFSRIKHHDETTRHDTAAYSAYLNRGPALVTLRCPTPCRHTLGHVYASPRGPLFVLVMNMTRGQMHEWAGKERNDGRGVWVHVDLLETGDRPVPAFVCRKGHRGTVDRGDLLRSARAARGKSVDLAANYS